MKYLKIPIKDEPEDRYSQEEGYAYVGRGESLWLKIPGDYGILMSGSYFKLIQKFLVEEEDMVKPLREMTLSEVIEEVMTPQEPFLSTEELVTECLDELNEQDEIDELLDEAVTIDLGDTPIGPPDAGLVGEEEGS